jgi:hypothetical protein
LDLQAQGSRLQGLPRHRRLAEDLLRLWCEGVRLGSEWVAAGGSVAGKNGMQLKWVLGFTIVYILHT